MRKGFNNPDFLKEVLRKENPFGEDSFQNAKKQLSLLGLAYSLILILLAIC